MAMSTPDPSSSGPYASAATTYWEAGWPGPLPLPARHKTPPPEGFTGWDGDWPSYPDVFAWTEDRPLSSIGLRLPPGVIGIDVDDYADKHGGLTVASCEERWGPLPPTWRSTSRDDGVSGIRLYRVPEGLEWPGVLPGGDVETIHFGHRYAVVWPSIHPEGRTYRWIDAYGVVSMAVPSPVNLPMLPPAWIAGLSLGLHVAQARASMDSAAVTGWLGSLPSSMEAPCPFMVRRVTTALQAITESGSRHDTARDQVLALVRFGETGHTGLGAALNAVQGGFVRLVTGDKSRTTREAYAEWGRITDGAVRIVAGNPEPPVLLGDPCPPVMAKLRVPPPRLTPSNSVLTPSTTPSMPPPAETPNPVQTPSNPVHTSWWPKDLTDILAGKASEAPPNFLCRSDGQFLLYPGRINGIIGPSESGKTWLVLLGVLQAISNGMRILYLDFEAEAKGIITRLKILGAIDDDLLTYLRYIRPEENPFTNGGAGNDDLYTTLEEFQPAHIVLDGVNSAMTYMGKDLMSNTDATEFSQKFLAPLVNEHRGLTYIDHTPKNNTESMGAIGAQAKRAMTTGCCLRVDVKKPWGKVRAAPMSVIVDKDRPGDVRGIAVEARDLGLAHFDSDPLTKTMEITIRAEGSSVDENGQFRPTTLMQRISEWLEENPEEASIGDIERGVVGNANYKRKGLEILVAEHYVARKRDGQAKLHTLIRPYRAPTPSTPSNPVHTPSKTEAEGTPSTPSPPRGDGVGVQGSFEDHLEDNPVHPITAVPNASGPRLVTDEIGVDADGDFYRIDTGEKLTQRQADKLLEDE